MIRHGISPNGKKPGFAVLAGTDLVHVVLVKIDPGGPLLRQFDETGFYKIAVGRVKTEPVGRPVSIQILEEIPLRIAGKPLRVELLDGVVDVMPVIGNVLDATAIHRIQEEFLE
jgi:hypothetical protein